MNALSIMTILQYKKACNGDENKKAYKSDQNRKTYKGDENSVKFLKPTNLKHKQHDNTSN